ncbi:hypothetical protein J4U37_22175, partial [Escherichia coli]
FFGFLLLCLSFVSVPFLEGFIIIGLRGFITAFKEARTENRTHKRISSIIFHIQTSLPRII